VNEFEYGAEMERKVAERLRRKGWKVKMSPASRGPYDLLAKKGRRLWLVQVKATRRPVTFVEKLSTEERDALICVADSRMAVPVLALVAKGWIFFLSARRWRHLRL
jgi:Holliday junction resolvase